MIKQKIEEKKNQTKILLIIFLGLMLFAINRNLVNENIFASEFTPMYVRGRALIEENLSPYSIDTRNKVEETFLTFQKDNNSWLVNLSNFQKDQNFIFLYGIPSLILMFIPILIPIHKTAFIVWLLINEIAIIGIIFSISAIIPKRNRRMVIIFLISALFFLPIVFFALMNGSLVIVEMCFAWLTVYFIVNEKDEIAGIFLGLLIGRFVFFLPFLLAVLIYLFSQKRFHILKSYLLVNIIFIGVSFLIDPQWIFELFYTISISIDQIGFGILSKIIITKSEFLILFFITLFLGLLILEFILAMKRKMLSFIWFIVLQFSFLPLLGLPISIADYFVLYPATAIIIIGWYAKLGKKLSTNLYLVSSILSFILWILILQQIPIMWIELFTLILIIGNLYWVRWWIIEFEKLPQSRKEKIKVALKKRFKWNKREKELDDIS